MTKHGDCRRADGKAKEWLVWHGMVQRCHDPKHTCFHRYGARGIAVCERWRNSYENFLFDMGRMPTPKHTIDRIKNELGYGPDNCRWATRTEQANNRTSNRFIFHDGENLTIAQWSRKTGIKAPTLAKRLDAGWPVRDALEGRAVA